MMVKSLSTTSLGSYSMPRLAKPSRYPSIREVDGTVPCTPLMNPILWQPRSIRCSTASLAPTSDSTRTLSTGVSSGTRPITTTRP